MDEPRTPGSTANEGQNQQSDPGQRMRNIMDGSDANDQQMREQPAAAGDESKSDSAPQPAGSGVEDTPAPTAPVSDTQRHPTGDPDATGGWYQAEPLAPQPPTEQPESDPHAAATRVTPVADGTPADATIVSHSEPSFPNTNTIPVPGRTGARYRGQNPRRVEQSDPNATRVTPAAYSTGRSRPSASQAQEQTRAVPPRRGRPTAQAAQPSSSYPPTYRRSVGMQGPAPARQAVPPSGWKRGLGCLLRLMIALIFVVIFLVLAAGSWLVIQYFTIAQGLPPVEQLRQNASQFETTRIYDRNGGVLYEIIDPNAGRRTTVPLQRISPYVVAATIATEDREFYNHPGFDPVAIARAFYQNYTSGEVVSGASTITQQLARTLLLSPEERFERSYERKAREIVLAAEITRTYSKDEILALYLNESNYGNLAYGIEAAAETYFGKTASDLTLGQAAFLAGLPQSPAVHDIFTNREGTLNRQKQVVLLMLEASQIKGCIYVSNSTQRVCVDEAAAVQAVQEIETYNFQMAENNLRYPHWVTYIRALLEAQFDPQTIYRSGFNVYTTLDPVLQDQAQAIVSQQVASLADRNAFNGALVALRPSTGEILAMVGSPDFNDEAHSGQVNMAVSPRQPGSSIKPLTYVAAFEKGWTPATLIWDVPSEFPPSGDPSDTREPYRPVNYDGRFHGPATLRSALANSYNIPAVKALQFVGIYNEGGLIQFAQRLGINTLTRPDYGLSLTLGGGEVTLLDMTSAFSAFANQGKRVAPVSILRITDYQGNPVYEYQPTVGQQVIRPEHAYLISSILSDNAAREPMFGANSVLNLPFQAAAKTGTTNDFRDNWTIGYTPDLAVGVWIGNADYTEMQNVTGLTGAAPAWSSFMQVAVPMLTNNSPTPFQRPAGVEERVVCVYSGTEPSEFCPQQRSEIFAAGQPPLPKEQDLWRRVNIDTWTGLRASAVCGEFTKEIFTLNVEDPWAINWIKDTDDGRAWAANLGFNAPITFVPARECNTSDPRPNIFFSNLSDNQTIVTSPLDIYVIANATANFQSFRVEWGPGDDPVEWQPLTESIANQYANPERVAAWDLSSIPSGRVTLRLYMQSTDGERFAERRIHLNLNVPTPTPTPTPTMTITPSPTPTFTPTITPSITPTPSPTSSPTPTSTPTITPQPTATIGA